MNIKEKLKKLGFTENLIAVYLSLFDTEASKAGEMIERTGLQRSVVYTGLDELTERGLVSKTLVNGVATFRANNPESLEEELEHQKLIARSVAEEIKKKQTEVPREVAVFEGVEGIKRATNRNLAAPEGTTSYFLGPSKFGVQKELERFWHEYHKRRIKKHIRSKILYDRATPESILKDRNNLETCEARYLPFGMELPMWFNICGDFVSMVVPGEDPPLVFSVRSRATAEALVNYFEYLWNQSRT